MEKICKNCQLYRNGACDVAVIIEGEYYELPVKETDSCHWERLENDINKDLTKELKYSNPYFKAKLSEAIETPILVNKLRMWTDGKKDFVELPVNTKLTP
jgi:hypothetical protein